MHLTEVLDTHGNRLAITYASEERNIECTGNPTYVRAIRPTRIEYVASGRSLASVRIELGYSTRSDTGVPCQR